ncbi:MAG: hypothetical protein H8E26_11580 [FCB group bacterium]|nr:hypothetical protein [FCB group bacterium]MBL7028579.1 hypothetical protein [Candidatus Neomarinimicrobiota bacterium]MBL7120798.1 hypothetical protein [Candidatus Neomarinimicrobiota bacterium]
MIPFKEFQTQDKARLFWLLFGLTVLTIVGMQLTGSALVNETAPGGIVTFELVGTLAGSQAIVDSWQGSAMTWAGINMGLDFLFLFLYGLTIALGCLILANRIPEKFQSLKTLGRWLALGILVAAGLDVIENISLILLLTGSENEFLSPLARWMAIPKFGLVLLSLLYIVGGGVRELMSRTKMSNETA